MAALVWRAKDLGVIDDTIYTRAMKAYQRAGGWRKVEPGVLSGRPATIRCSGYRNRADRDRLQGPRFDRSLLSRTGPAPSTRPRPEDRVQTKAITDRLIRAKLTLDVWD